MGYFQSKGGGEEKLPGLIQQHLRVTNSQHILTILRPKRSLRMVLGPGEVVAATGGETASPQKGREQGEGIFNKTLSSCLQSPDITFHWPDSTGHLRAREPEDTGVGQTHESNHNRRR